MDKTPVTTQDSKNPIQVIERMMKLLEVLAEHSDPVPLKLIAQETQLHPSTAHRILGSMAQAGFVQRSDGGSYRLGIRLLELGSLVKSRLSLRETAMEAMLRLHAATGESVNLGIRDKDEIVYVERTSSGRSAVRVVHTRPGRCDQSQGVCPAHRAPRVHPELHHYPPGSGKGTRSRASAQRRLRPR